MVPYCCSVVLFAGIIFLGRHSERDRHSAATASIWRRRFWYRRPNSAPSRSNRTTTVRYRKRGAGGQCGYPNFCPTFVLCLAFVQHTSSICPHFVLVKHLSNKCPKCPTFVPSKSNMCLNSQTVVLHLSSDFVKTHPKIEKRNLVISWT